jgi:hypothetical protein
MPARSPHRVAVLALADVLPMEVGIPFQVLQRRT